MRHDTIAVVGGGPAGSALATWLARAGCRVALFDPGRRPALVVGESLVPAVMPHLRDLGVADEVASYSQLKPGATFVLDHARVVHSFRFAQIPRGREPVAYNVPRDRYDATLLAAAERAGARRVRERARLRREGDRVLLDDATVEAAGDALDGRQPDLVVDATGRARTLARLLDLPHEQGPRKDVALFAHVDGLPVIDEGHVHTDVLDWGWAWRIPLPGRVSVGFVVDAERAGPIADTDEGRFDAMLATDSVARGWGGAPRRLTPVFRYQNYSLTTLRGFGENWALVGDAFGFVDPVFSSGMLVTLSSARELAGALTTGRGETRALRAWEASQIAHLRGWREAVQTFYDGKLWSVLEVGQRLKASTRLGAAVAPHFEYHLPRVFTGEGTRQPYTRWLLRMLCRHGLIDVDVARYAVRA